MTQKAGGKAAGSTPHDYDRAVFINCPFNPNFADSLHAIIFAVVCCGMKPRSALSAANVADTRIERLAQELCSCRYSIHDLSLLKADEKTGVAHMNMPLELGMAVALHRAPRRSNDPLRHDWTALVLTNSAYTDALSDANGNDLQRYSTRKELVAEIMYWLTPRVTHAQVRATPSSVDAELDNLLGLLKREGAAWFNKLPWMKTVDLAEDVARAAHLLPGAGPAP